MHGAEENFKEHGAESCETQEDYTEPMNKEQDAIHAKNKEGIREINLSLIHS